MTCGCCETSSHKEHCLACPYYGTQSATDATLPAEGAASSRTEPLLMSDIPCDEVGHD